MGERGHGGRFFLKTPNQNRCPPMGCTSNLKMKPPHLKNNKNFEEPPTCSQQLWETLSPVLYPDIFSHCWISIGIVKQVLINNSWTSPTLQTGWKLEFCLFFKKWGRVHFSLKKEEVGKIEEWRLLRENNVYLLIFVFINPRNIAIPGTHIKVKSFIIYPNFWDKVLSKI